MCLFSFRGNLTENTHIIQIYNKKLLSFVKSRLRSPQSKRGKGKDMIMSQQQLNI